MRISKSIQIRMFWTIIVLVSLWASVQEIGLTTPSPHNDDLIINEFMAANRSGLLDEDGDYADWIEIHNPNAQAVNLAGWALTDDADQPQKWPFPDIVLEHNGYLVVFASGKDRKPTHPEAALHTNFKLNQEGEFLGLYNIVDDRFASIPAATDEEDFPEQLTDIAFGRYSDALAYGYLVGPTPGRPNEEEPLWTGLTAPITFSQKRGFYNAPFTLELTTTTLDTTIRYTTDGSPPTEKHGTLYTTPLSITTTTLVRAVAFRPHFRPSPIETHTYIFPQAVLTQPQAPSGFPKTWGGYEGVPVQADYAMDLEVVNDPHYRDAIEGALQSIPSVSIVTDQQSFQDIYLNPQRRGRPWERPASVELIDPTNQQPGFQIDAGVRIQGGLGRSEFIPKHAFRLFFRGEYGAGKLTYPLFPQSPVKEFDTLVLRSGVNRSYAGYPEREEEIKLTTYTRDEWLRASQLAMSGSGAHGMFVHLYLNGLYWGLYNLVERPDDAFMAAYFGGAEEDWQTINHAETTSNSSDRFKTLHDLADKGDLDNPEAYAALQEYLDVPHFIDYLIVNWYSGNLDWGFNNWYAGVGSASGPVRYFVWDGERTWIEGAEIYMEFDEYNDQPNRVKPLLNALLDNPDFRSELADRLFKHLFNDGALTESQARHRWQAINQVVEPAIIAESARWGDVRFDPPLTQADWFEARDDVLQQMEGNPARMIDIAREAGYYPKLDPPRFDRPEGQIRPGTTLNLEIPDSQERIIFYTTDGSDPRLPITGAVSPVASIYRKPLVLTKTTHLKARAFGQGEWSALNEAIYHVDKAKSTLQITEIMYNPSGGDDYEFIELKNTGNTPLNLAHMSFEGIRFTFPPDEALLSPGALRVLVRNPQAFAQRYPNIPIGGVYQGQLSNKGETMTLRDGTGEVVVSIPYDDDNGWPVSADGRGDSLVLINPHRDASKATNWRASQTLNGTPHSDEP